MILDAEWNGSSWELVARRPPDYDVGAWTNRVDDATLHVLVGNAIAETLIVERDRLAPGDRGGDV